jgi:16S rRNA (cytosine1402-N4)-methyltransferase
MTGYHIPVMLKESIDALCIEPDGIYVDATFGGGGHSKEILKKLTTGKLLAFDQDDDAATNVFEDEKFIFIKHNFRYMKNFLRYYGIFKINGLLADLGVSSHHFNSKERGFAYRFDTRLDMRMNRGIEKSAQYIVNNYSKEKLDELFQQYSEIRNPGRITDAIIEAREEKILQTTAELIDCISRYAPKSKENKFYSRVFQAIRIEVNNEIESLKEMLLQTADLIRKDGRLVVISYHAVEDRLVKNYMKAGNFIGDIRKDFYGNVLAPFHPLKGGRTMPGEKELEKNSRARSARLRIAVKN